MQRYVSTSQTDPQAAADEARVARGHDSDGANRQRASNRRHLDAMASDADVLHRLRDTTMHFGG